MKRYSWLLLCLIVVPVYSGRLLAQSCQNCWINPKTGQVEPFRIDIPSPRPQTTPITTPSPQVSESPKPDSPDDEAKKKPPIVDDPLAEEIPPEPKPLPTTQIRPIRQP